MAFWVYLLECADGSYYIGHSDQLENRLSQHQTAGIPGCYTASRLPVKLVFSQSFSTRDEALASERQIKGWSRKKKQALIAGDWSEIVRLSNQKGPIETKP